MGSHYLVVGGTGMLSGVVERLIKDGNMVSILSRGEDNFRKLKLNLKSDNIFHIACDYHDADATKKKLELHTHKFGLFNFAICWVHEPSDIDTCSTIAHYTECTLWHVVGSSAADPSKPKKLEQNSMYFSKMHPNIDYRIIILGFIIDKGLIFKSSRWLSNYEISDGVNHALDNDLKITTIGTTMPWTFRPAFH
ncbi:MULTISPECIES: hypothetical protein [unclassified Rahnella]|uniref:hypothetical protein n=1 Tax=Yersiniaceae TaxID=1903411 RepID=UPI00129563DB|nr:MULTISPECIES: hypothetical protein [unclassified Rahnella]MCM2446900.1 hypothetical protein [Rahnella sp. CG8]